MNPTDSLVDLLRNIKLCGGYCPGDELYKTDAEVIAAAIRQHQAVPESSLIEQIMKAADPDDGLVSMRDVERIICRHYEGRPAVEGKPIELMTRDELLAHIKQQRGEFDLDNIGADVLDRALSAALKAWDKSGKGYVAKAAYKKRISEHNKLYGIHTPTSLIEQSIDRETDAYRAGCKAFMACTGNDEGKFLAGLRAYETANANQDHGYQAKAASEVERLNEKYALNAVMRSDSIGSPMRYTDGSYSREYEEQPQDERSEGMAEDLSQLIRVCLTNPGDVGGFIEANYPKEFAAAIEANRGKTLPSGYSLDKRPKCGGPADNGHGRCLPPNPYYCTKCTAESIARSGYKMPDGRPIFGPRSPHNISEHLDAVCSGEIPVVEMEKLIMSAVEAGNTEYWRPSNEHDAALREWKLSGFKGEKPSQQNHHGKSIIDCISDSVKQNILPYLRSPEPVLVDLEVGAKALWQGLPAWEQCSDGHKLHWREKAIACAEAWGLKWR